MSETVILQRILLALGSRPDCRVWRNNSGRLPDQRTGRWVSFGLKGSADILGLLRGGRLLAIEVKTEKGSLRPEQKNFRDMIQSMGGLYVVARSEQDAVQAVESACQS